MVFRLYSANSQQSSNTLIKALGGELHGPRFLCSLIRLFKLELPFLQMKDCALTATFTVEPTEMVSC